MTTFVAVLVGDVGGIALLAAVFLLSPADHTGRRRKSSIGLSARLNDGGAALSARLITATELGGVCQSP